MKAAMPSCDDAVFLRPLYLMVAILPICLLLDTPLHAQSGARASKIGITALLSVRTFLSSAYVHRLRCKKCCADHPLERDQAQSAVEYHLFRLVLEMATKGAHVFRLQKVEITQ